MLSAGGGGGVGMSGLNWSQLSWSHEQPAALPRTKENVKATASRFLPRVFFRAFCGVSTTINSPGTATGVAGDPSGRSRTSPARGGPPPAPPDPTPAATVPPIPAGLAATPSSHGSTAGHLEPGCDNW